MFIAYGLQGLHSLNLIFEDFNKGYIIVCAFTE